MFDQKKIIGGAVPKYNLSIGTHPNATITLTPGPGKYKAGTQIRVNVACSTGWQLGTITWNGTSIANGETFLMPKGDCAVSCTTSQINYTITKSVPTGGGSITCAATAHYNDTVTYSTSASANWAFSNCALSGAKTQTLAASGSFVMPAGNVTITANFSKEYSYLKINNPTNTNKSIIIAGGVAKEINAYGYHEIKCRPKLLIKISCFSNEGNKRQYYAMSFNPSPSDLKEIPSTYTFTILYDDITLTITNTVTYTYNIP